MNYTLTTQVGNVTLTRITPLSHDIVRFSLTAKIPGGATRFTATTLTLYTALLLTRTKRKQKSAIEEYLKQYGIDLSIQSGNESVSFVGSVRHEQISRLVTLLTELLFETVVDATEFSQKKKLALEANREAHDDAKRINHTAFINSLYAHEPRLTLNTLSEERVHIQKTTAINIERVQTALLESAWFVSIVGDVKAEYGFLPLVKALSAHACAYEHTKIIAKPIASRSLFTNVASKTNIEVAVGNVVEICNTDPASVALDFGIDVLGKTGGFFGRLMSTVREKEGLTYGIYAHTQSYHRGDSLHFVIRTFFMAKDYEKGMTSTLRELKNIVEKGVTEKEIAIFKEINRNQYILAHESNLTRLKLYHALIVQGYNEALYREYQEKVASLTRKQINSALKENIDLNRLVISASGPITHHGKPIIPAKT